MSREPIRDKIIEIANEMLAGFSSSDSLLDQFDSLQIITLVNQVEQAFKVEIPAIELSQDNLSSVETLSALIEKYASN